jgi:hypothetical protein
VNLPASSARRRFHLSTIRQNLHRHETIQWRLARFENKPHPPWPISSMISTCGNRLEPLETGRFGLCPKNCATMLRLIFLSNNTSTHQPPDCPHLNSIGTGAAFLADFPKSYVEKKGRLDLHPCQR